MIDVRSVERGRSLRSRAALLAAIVAVALVGLVVTTWIARHFGSPGWTGVVMVAVLVVAIGGIVVASGTGSEGWTWLGTVGLAVVALGSGLGRPGDDEVFLGNDQGGGDVVARLDTWWPVVAIGLVLLLAALGWMSVRVIGGRFEQGAALGSLLGLALGVVALAVVTREVVVGQWVEGRPIRRRRRVPERPNPSLPGGADGSGVEALWLSAAADEAAAVVAFGDLGLRLARVGAPRALIQRCQVAAGDEIRHARTCAAFARRHPPDDRAHDGRPEPTPADVEGARRSSRRAELVRLAVESFVDGVMGEGFAARRLDAGSVTVATSAGAAALRVMATEERRHAALGADVVRWCTSQHPFLVVAALRAAARRLPAEVAAPSGYGSIAPDELADAGLVDPATARALWSEERQRAVAWLDDLVDAGSARGTEPVAA